MWSGNAAFGVRFCSGCSWFSLEMHFHYRNEALGGSVYILILLVEMGLVALLTRKRSHARPGTACARKKSCTRGNIGDVGLLRNHPGDVTSARQALVRRRYCTAPEWIAGRGDASTIPR